VLETQRRPGEAPIGYIVSAWPRLSETFILNEVFALERLGTPLHIFSIKEPGPAPVHPKVSQVRAKLTRLSAARGWKSALGPSLRLISKHPVRFFRTLLEAWRHRASSGGRRFCQAVSLADQLEREPVAHFHAHFANAPAVVAMFVHTLTGIPYTFTAHAKDIYVKTSPELLGAEIERAEAVVTCTEYNRQYLLSRFSSRCDGKLRRIYHGLDLSEFDFSWPHGSDGEPPVILSVARLVEKKGLSLLIAAAGILSRRGKHIQVEIIGDGSLRPALEAQAAESGLRDRIKFLGAQPHDVVRQAFQRASVFALPCTVAADGDRDGIPNVLLEAMASGTPVVSTPVSGIPELIESGSNGLLVPPENPMLLAEALQRLLGDMEYSERLARAARAKIENEFSMERSASSLAALFRNGR